MKAFFFLLIATLPHFLVAQEFEKDVTPLIKKYCVSCHSGDDPDGDVDFSKTQTSKDAVQKFEVWQKAAKLLSAGEMPPEDELQPTRTEIELILDWYQKQFVQSVKAKPGEFRPRRLAAYEYRNTLESLLGFKLDVAIVEAEQTVVEKSLVLKLLPVDPPGRSGFTNDTSGNPLTTVTWDQYSNLVDAGLEELFSKSRRKQLEFYTGEIPKNGLTIAQAENMVRAFVPRAYRRTVDENVLTAIMTRLKQSDDLADSLKVELKMVLMSPRFIYRGLVMDNVPGKQQLVDEFELAERLSYFIWGDMPDDELMNLASEKKLRDPKIFKAQIDRLLKSPKARSLAENFGVEWFALNEIDQLSNNPPFAIALKSQPVDYLHHLFTDGRPLMELIDSRTAFVSPLSAGHYDKKDRAQMTPYSRQRGIEIEAVPNQKITLVHTKNRGGLLTIPGVLAMNKGPVLRGTWILERILGEHLPDPPADVGQVAGNKRGENLTFRQRFEMHRSNATCAVCHDKIDPLGFALQGYDSKGGSNSSQIKKKDKGNASGELDTSGQLPSGEKFDDFDGLKRILVTSQRERVIRNIVKQTLAYALCRKLELHDQPTVEQMVQQLKNEGTFRDLVHQVASSLPFQETQFANIDE